MGNSLIRGTTLIFPPRASFDWFDKLTTGKLGTGRGKINPGNKHMTPQ
jgi:hypothetical protein